MLYFFSSLFFSSVVPELLLAPELGAALEESVEEPPLELVLGDVLDEDEPLLGVLLGAALDEDDAEPLGEVVLGELLDELEPELGVLGVVTLPEAEPLAVPGARVVSLVDDPDEDEAEPEGEDGVVVAPRELAPVSGPRSQP